MILLYFYISIFPIIQEIETTKIILIYCTTTHNTQIICHILNAKFHNKST
jgi:hypothetical protein